MSNNFGTDSSLHGAVAIVTGGSKGTGLGIARAFAKEGIAVTLTGRSQSALDAAKTELTGLASGARVLTVQADTLANAIARQTGQFEASVLSHKYLHLAPLVGTA